MLRHWRGLADEHGARLAVVEHLSLDTAAMDADAALARVLAHAGAA